MSPLEYIVVCLRWPLSTVQKPELGSRLESGPAAGPKSESGHESDEDRTRVRDQHWIGAMIGINTGLGTELRFGTGIEWGPGSGS